MNGSYDVAVVGAGIVGLAHAYHLARAGKRVLVLERHARAQGASIRNFGMLWPIGQPLGPQHDLARRSLEIWHEVLHASGLWHERTGSLHLAYHEDELQVLREFVQTARLIAPCALLTPAEVAARSPHVVPTGLRGGLWSGSETCVDPREVVAKLPEWLSREHGVEFQWSCPVHGYDGALLSTARGDWSVPKLIVCCGDQLDALYPKSLAKRGLTRCKLQMLRTRPAAPGWRLGPMLAAGLTLCHYKSFADCPTIGALRERFQRELPDYVRLGIHVLASQNGARELTLGDSHEYGDDISIFDKPEIEALILAYLRGFLDVSDLDIASRWHGHYVKHPAEPFIVEKPAKGVTIVTGLGGAGMTLSFGLAERVVGEML